MRVIGFDPDLHNSGVAVFKDGHLEAVDLVTIPKELKGRTAALAMASAVAHRLSRLRTDLSWDGDIDYNGAIRLAAEYMKVYRGGGEKAADLINLSFITGAACAMFNPDEVRVPLAAEWKGQVPKRIHQARTLKGEGLEYTVQGKNRDLFRVDWGPVWPDPPKALGKQSHVIDAVGLGRWCVQRHAH